VRPCDHEAARAFVRWQHAAGPYWPYVCAAPFLGGPIARRSRPRRHDTSLVAALRGLPAGERTAVFVDLPASRTLPSADDLARLGFLVVPVIQRWATAPAVLACESLVAQLLDCAPRRRPPSAQRGVIFLLDGERAGPSTSPKPRLFDNRYSYPICRFPPPGFLHEDGISNVVWLPGLPIAQDLLPYAQVLTEEGLMPEGLGAT
jgi:hypothetical protein